MYLFKRRYYSVATKIIIVYGVIVLTFVAAFFTLYMLSKQEIDRKQKNANIESFLNQISLIDAVFQQLQSAAFELRSDLRIKPGAGGGDPLSQYNVVNTLNKSANRLGYVDDVFVYNPGNDVFISAQGTMTAQVYFRSIYTSPTLSGHWREMFRSGRDIVVNVTKYPEPRADNRRDFYQRLLVVDNHTSHRGEVPVGFVIDVRKVFRGHGADGNNVFVAGEGGRGLESFPSMHLKDAEPATLRAETHVSTAKMGDSLVFHVSDESRNLVYLKMVHMEQYYKDMQSHYFGMIFIASLLAAVIAVSSWSLSKYNRNLKSIRNVLEDGFVRNMLVKRQGGELLQHVKTFLGLQSMMSLYVLMVGRRWKSAEHAPTGRPYCDERLHRLFTARMIRYRCFEYSPLKTIFILDAKSVKDPARLIRALESCLREDGGSPELSLNVFLSRRYDGKQAIEKALDEVVELGERAPVGISGQVVTAEHDMPEYYFIPGEMRNWIRNAMALEEKSTALKLIKELLTDNLERGVSQRHWRQLIAAVNTMLLEAAAAKFPERYGTLADFIQPLNDAAEQCEAEHTIRMYESVLARIAAEGSSREVKGGNDLGSIFIRYIEDHYMQDIYLESMARHFNLSAKYVSSKFKELTGESFTEYVNRYRISVAKELLRTTRHKVNQISELVGYRHVNVFIRQFKRLEGVTPNAYRDIGWINGKPGL